MGRKDNVTRVLTEEVLGACLNHCRAGSNNRDDWSSKLAVLAKSVSFRQIIYVLAESDPLLLTARSWTRQSRCDELLGNMEHAGFCDLTTREGVRECIYAAYGYLAGVPYWRLQPYGIWIEADGGIVVFDRDYKCIARLRVMEPLELLHPSTRIEIVHRRYFYEDAIAPYLDPATAPLLDRLSKVLSIDAEVAYRQELSDFGRLPPEVWTQRWKKRA